MADKMMMGKYIGKNVAHRHGKTVTYIKALGDNEAIHTQQSIRKTQANTPTRYAGGSEPAGPQPSKQARVPSSCPLPATAPGPSLRR